MQTPLKRFYKDVAVASRDGVHQVTLDGRVLRSPAKADLHFPSDALAEAVAEEWAGQTERIDAASMPLMTLSSTAVDYVRPRRTAIVEELVGFAGHDLVCYWCDEPQELLRRQQETWQPLLNWTALTFDAPLSVVRGVISEDQPPGSLEALRREVAAIEDFPLMALLSTCQASGSLVIALALLKGRLTAQEAFAASLLDEHYQMERWGRDAEALRRHEALQEDLQQAERLLALLKP